MSIEMQELLSMSIGSTRQLNVKITPDSATNKTVTWTTTDPSGVITILNGMVKAVKAGYAYVHAKAGVYTATCYVKVSEKTHLSSIKQDVFWCQTGGWSNLDGDGSAECARTAIATMVSINTNSIFTPNETVSDSSSITIYGIKKVRNDADGDGISDDIDYSYSDLIKKGTRRGFYRYKFSSEVEILYAINYELNNGRAVVVKTNGSSYKQHWVTVTKVDSTESGFAQLYGIDPWYNGSNLSNEKTGLYDSTNLSKSGEIQLINGVKNNGNNPDFNPEYRIFTFNLD